MSSWYKFGSIFWLTFINWDNYISRFAGSASSPSCLSQPTGFNLSHIIRIIKWEFIRILVYRASLNNLCCLGMFCLVPESANWQTFVTYYFKLRISFYLQQFQLTLILAHHWPMALPALEWKEPRGVVCEVLQLDRGLISDLSAKPGRWICILMWYVFQIEWVISIY